MAGLLVASLVGRECCCGVVDHRPPTDLEVVGVTILPMVKHREVFSGFAWDGDQLTEERQADGEGFHGVDPFCEWLRTGPIVSIECEFVRLNRSKHLIRQDSSKVRKVSTK